MNHLQKLVLLGFVALASCDEEGQERLHKRGIDHYSHQQVHTDYVERLQAVHVPSPIHIPAPVHVNVPIHVPHPVAVHVPVEVPVYKPVGIPVEKPLPYLVLKPYPVEVIERVPFPVPHPVPVPYPILKVKHHYKEIYSPKGWW